MNPKKRSPKKKSKPNEPLQGITLDTGILIALVDSDARAWKVINEAAEQYRRITVPAPVIAEWWPGPSGQHPQVLKLVTEIEATTAEIAKAAGKARAAESIDSDEKRRISGIDAIVMASANARGDIVYTDDGTDLARLAPYFKRVTLRSLKSVR